MYDAVHLPATRLGQHRQRERTRARASERERNRERERERKRERERERGERREEGRGGKEEGEKETCFTSIAGGARGLRALRIAPAGLWPGGGRASNEGGTGFDGLGIGAGSLGLSFRVGGAGTGEVASSSSNSSSLYSPMPPPTTPSRSQWESGQGRQGGPCEEASESKRERELLLLQTAVWAKPILSTRHPTTTGEPLLPRGLPPSLPLRGERARDTPHSVSGFRSPHAAHGTGGVLGQTPAVSSSNFSSFHASLESSATPSAR